MIMTLSIRSLKSLKNTLCSRKSLWLSIMTHLRVIFSIRMKAKETLDAIAAELHDKLEFFDAGTLVNNYQKGSSLIGEGLASCMYSFPRLDDEDRTRIIIMSTDNAQESLKSPLVELDEAAQICKKNHIKVFGLFPNRENWSGLNSSDYDTDIVEFQKAVEGTGGKFYKESETLSVEDIVKDIERIEALEVEEVTTTKINDQPKVPVIILVSSIVIMLGMGLVMRI